MKTFKNKNYSKRNYECTNVIACQSETAPNENYIECNESELNGLTQLHTIDGVRYYGYL